MSGALPVHDLEAIIGVVQHDESVTTASGWVTQKLGGFPRAGDTVPAGDYELQVEEMDGLRVARLKITQVRFNSSEPAISPREPKNIP